VSSTRILLSALVLLAGCRARAPNAASATDAEAFALAEIARDEALTPSDAMAAPPAAEVLPAGASGLRVRLGEPADEMRLPLIPLAPRPDGRSLVLAVEWQSRSVAYDPQRADRMYTYPLVALREPFLATAADIERVEIVETHEYVCHNDSTGHTAWHLRVVPSARVRAELVRRLDNVAVLVHGRIVGVGTGDDHVVLFSHELRDVIADTGDDRAFLESTARDLCRVAGCSVKTIRM
jgi:hypothetical protein